MPRRKWYGSRPRSARSTSSYCAEQPSPPIDAYEPACQQLQQGDERYCPPCGLRWGCDEDRPTCLRARR